MGINWGRALMTGTSGALDSRRALEIAERLRVDAEARDLASRQTLAGERLEGDRGLVQLRHDLGQEAAANKPPEPMSMTGIAALIKAVGLEKAQALLSSPGGPDPQAVVGAAGDRAKRVASDKVTRANAAVDLLDVPPKVKNRLRAMISAGEDDGFWEMYEGYVDPKPDDPEGPNLRIIETSGPNGEPVRQVVDMNSLVAGQTLPGSYREPDEPDQPPKPPAMTPEARDAQYVAALEGLVREAKVGGRGAEVDDVLSKATYESIDPLQALLRAGLISDEQVQKMIGGLGNAGRQVTQQAGSSLAEQMAAFNENLAGMVAEQQRRAGNQ